MAVRWYQNLPIRRKLLVSMLTFTVIPVMLITAVALRITYSTMRDQLINNYRMSSGWLRERLELEVKNYTGQFYDFEVNKAVKADIVNWCTSGQEPSFEAKWRMISALNATISMDSTINSIDLYNLSNGTVLVAERSGARLGKTEKRLDKWHARGEGAQTNVVFWREGNEILIAHQMTHFQSKLPLALVVIHVRPYQLQRILSGIKTSADESIIVLSDQNESIEADYGEESNFTEKEILGIASALAGTTARETLHNGDFWFYRTVNGGKLQVLLTVPNGNITSALWTTFLSGLIAAVIAVGASAFASIIYSRAITRPIAELSETMRNFTLQDVAAITSRTDEIGVLEESFTVMVERNQELVAAEFQTKLEKRNAQLRALQAQINPHFMYNTLQVIGGIALKKQAPEIYGVTTALSDIMRYSLNFSKEMVSLREELRYLEAYLTIQNQRFGGRIQLESELAPETMDCMIPKLILQPLIENSFEHGLVDKAGAWNIRITGAVTAGGDLSLAVADNGLGIPEWRLRQIQEELTRDAEKALRSGSHIGLCNVDARLRLRYPGGGYRVTVESAEGEGTTVRVLLQAVREEAHDGEV